MQSKVLVVGAGPVGLTMAMELARYGVAVRIVEKAAQRTDKSKALVLWSRSLELLARAAPADDFIDAGRKVVAAEIRTSEKLIAKIDLTGVESPYPYALMLPQSDTERLLEARLATFGIAVERQVEWLGHNDDGGKVASVLRHADGREESVDSDWLLGCDGAHSAVRHALGLPFDGDTLPADFVLADAHLKGMPIPPSEIAVYWHRDGILAMFPITDGRYRIIADMGSSSGPHPTDPTLQEIQALVDRRGPPGLVLSDPIWLSAFRINERKVRDYQKGRVFVAGDAAHVHSPAGGQGMNTGMQDAFNLAWKLALVCRGTGNAETLLPSYSAERSAIGDKVLKDAGRLTMIATLRNHAAQTIRNAIGGILFGLASVRRAMADNMAEVTIGYAESPLNGPSLRKLGGPAPGARIPPVAGQSPIGAGGAPLFALYAAQSEATKHLLRDFPDLLEKDARPPLHEGGIWLARPDGYVAAVAAEPDISALADYLAALRA
jgi:2-polyprenyl-6-methoxyphenol hydroxylase-like FAD-dependent oxidoreductase